MRYLFLTQQTDKRRKLFLYFILLVEAIVLYFGVTLPLIKVSRFWIFGEEQSVVKILLIFYQHNEFLLLLLVSIMGFFLPFLKLIFRALELEGNFIIFISRFSSIDIFLISILIFIGKTISTIDVSLSSGFYFLCAGTIFGLVKIEKLLKPHIKHQYVENSNNLD